MEKRVYFQQSVSLVHNLAPKEEGQTNSWPLPKPWVFTCLFRTLLWPTWSLSYSRGLGDETTCACPVASVVSNSEIPWTVARQAHGISQARTLEWVVISSSRGSFQPRDRTRISCGSWVGRWTRHHLSHLGSPDRA